MNTLHRTKMTGIALLSALTVFTSQAQQTRPVGDFTGIKAGDAFSIVISQAESNSLKVDAEESVQPQIKTEVKEGILHISADGNIKTNKPMVLTIGIRNLNSLDISGSADVKSENQLTVDKLNIESSGAGDVHLDVKATEVKTRISGAGDVSLKGTAQNLDASISGAGELKSSNLEVDKAKVKVSGAGSAKVNVKQAIDADVSGAGDIIYKGNPSERSVNISGAGSVRESKIGTGEETASDTTKFKLGNKKYMIIGEGDIEKEIEAYNAKDSARSWNEKFKHWNGIDIGVNGLMDFNNSITPPASFLELNYAKSVHFGLNLVEKDFHIWKNHINLVTGFGFDFNHYAFANKVTLNADTSYLWASMDSSITYKKNKLNVSYIKMPLMLEINFSKNPNKNFHIAGGVEVAYRIHSVAKQRFDVGDVHIRTKQKDDFNLEPFRYSAVARIGFNKVTLYANYGLNRLFKKDKGPQVYPFTVGVTLAI